jgi:hypothetical protein
MIDRLENIDPHNQPYEQALEIFKSVRNFPAIIYTTELDELMVYRTRTHDDDVFFTEPRDVINPPSRFVTSFGRCNVCLVSQSFIVQRTGRLPIWSW